MLNIVIKNTDKSIILIRLPDRISMSLLYNAISLFAWYSTNLFFSDISLINREHVPSQGPTIVYGNHNNQFVDGIVNGSLFSYSSKQFKDMFVSSLQPSRCVELLWGVLSKLLELFLFKDRRT